MNFPRMEMDSSLPQSSQWKEDKSTAERLAPSFWSSWRVTCQTWTIWVRVDRRALLDEYNTGLNDSRVDLLQISRAILVTCLKSGRYSTWSCIKSVFTGCRASKSWYETDPVPDAVNNHRPPSIRMTEVTSKVLGMGKRRVRTGDNWDRVFLYACPWQYQILELLQGVPRRSGEQEWDLLDILNKSDFSLVVSERDLHVYCIW